MKPKTTGYLVTVGVLAALALPVNALTFYISIFATDSCSAADPTFICGGAGMLTLWALPWAGLALALACALGLGIPAAGRGVTPWLFLPVGVVVYVASMAATWAVMTA